MDVGFIQQFIIDQINGQRLCEIKTLVYRDGGVEISPGNVAPCIIPDRLLDHEREIEIDGETKIIKIHKVLEEGDPVIVAKYSGLTKYVILERANA